MPDPDSQKKIRVVVAKPGLDGHDRGAKIIARALRDAGMEVIYTGLHQTPEQIVETVIQEDADAVGLSILSGAHMTLVPRIMELLHEQGVDDVVVTVGGTIPADDIEELKRARRGRGVHARRADRRRSSTSSAAPSAPDARAAALADVYRRAAVPPQPIDSSVNRRYDPLSAHQRGAPLNEDLRPGQRGAGRRRREAHRPVDGADGPSG